MLRNALRRRQLYEDSRTVAGQLSCFDRLFDYPVHVNLHAPIRWHLVDKMSPQYGLLKTVLSFACGFLLGYQIYYVSRLHRKDGPPEDDTDGRSSEFTQLYEAIARIEEQLHQIRRKLEDSEEELANGKANKRSFASSGSVKGVTGCPSSEDIFYDTTDRYDSCQLYLPIRLTLL